MSQDRDPQEVRNVVAEVVDSVGLDAWLTNAEWGREFAKTLWATGDEDAIQYVLADGAETYRSKFMSRRKALARAASARILANGLSPDEFDHAVQQQLEFEVCAPGYPPVPLVFATHELLAMAYKVEMQKVLGHARNCAQLKRAMDATAAYPGATVEHLLEDGSITPRDLAPGDDLLALPS